jgi:prolyl oligopeptidase
MRLIISILLFCFYYSNMIAQLNYPTTRKADQIDDYHGTKVADPYRWLEDDRSEETATWVKAQNEVTFGYLNQIPYREKLKKRCEEVFNYEKYSSLFRNNEWYYFYKNDGLQNQSALYRQKGLDGTPELVIDPNQLSKDGTTRLTQFNISKNGKYAAYALSKGGSDWQEVFIMDLTTKKNLTDKLEWVKVSGIAWQGEGFYYSRYPAPQGSELSAKNENHQVYFHTINSAQSEDKLIFEDPTEPQRFNQVYVSEDESYAFLSISDRGKGKQGNILRYMQRGTNTFKPVINEINGFDYSVIHNIGDKFMIQTNANAPNEKVMLFDPKMPNEKDWKTLIPEKQEVLQYASMAGGKLFAVYMKDVTTKAYVYSLKGKLENEVMLPGVGTASGFGGNIDDKVVFYVYTSFSTPSTIYKYDIKTKKSTLFRQLNLPFDPTIFETKQVFYASKDGTKIPMFITYKKGTKLDGNNPTMLYGYGGFNISLQPGFSSLLIPFLENGGVYASANLRGGGEYGEKWHEQGIKLQKQNVFDDCIAAAEYLIAQKWTSPSKLAVRGGSNGGLLVGAVMNQRPDLFAVAIPQVGVMDMLRFHTFTIGWNWKPDYGSSENPDEFKALYAYSPLHNLKAGVAYPATMITTADHDDRVVPAHSFKYAATLQEKYRGDKPMLIRIDVNSGHGASNTKKNIELTADIYSFMFYNMGIKI